MPYSEAHVGTLGTYTYLDSDPKEATERRLHNYLPLLSAARFIFLPFYYVISFSSFLLHNLFLFLSLT